MGAKTAALRLLTIPGMRAFRDREKIFAQRVVRTCARRLAFYVNEDIAPVASHHTLPIFRV